MWQSLRRLIARIVEILESSESSDEEQRRQARVEEATQAETMVDTDDADEMYCIRIRSTEALREQHGYWPELISAEVLTRAFRRADLGYYIEWGKDETYNPPSEDPYANDFETTDWWHEHRPTSDASAHLLLTSKNGGGVTLGSAALAGAGEMSAGVKEPLVGMSDELHGAHAMAHEVGHALGIAGDWNTEKTGSQTSGKSWVDDDDRWHRTLVVSTDEAEENICGESLAVRGDRTIVFHQEYSDCSIDKFEDPLKRDVILS